MANASPSPSLQTAVMTPQESSVHNYTLFGTDGIRGAVATPPFRLEQLIRLGHALGSWIRTTYGPEQPILIAQDTRISCSFITAALQSGLLLHPLKIYNAGVLPTPVVYYMVRTSKQYVCGIMISASHNPYHDNGIKIIDSIQGKLKHEDENALSKLYASTTIADVSYDQLGTLLPISQAHTAYYEYIQRSFAHHFLCGRTIVLDCANGAASQLAPVLFARFGARVIVLHDQPTGTNINENCGSLYTKSLAQAVLSHQADVGFAFDGDGDRVIAINRQGQEKNGDDILALLISHPTYAPMPFVVGTLMTNQGLEKYLANKHIQLIRANVGDKQVTQQLEQYKVLLGGEPSGHIIIRDILESGDGIATALKIIETMCITDNWDMESFVKYPQVLLTLPITHKHDLTAPHLTALIDKKKALLISGRVLVRYSGTENSLRIMVEDETYENAHMVAHALASELSTALGIASHF